MMEERYHATAQNQFYPDMSNVNKNITVEAKLITPTARKCLCAKCLAFTTVKVQIALLWDVRPSSFIC